MSSTVAAPPKKKRRKRAKKSFGVVSIDSVSNYVQKLNECAQQKRCGPVSYQYHRSTDNSGHTFFRCIVTVESSSDGAAPSTPSSTDALHVGQKFASASTFSRKQKAAESAARTALLGLGFATVSGHAAKSSSADSMPESWSMIPMNVLLGICTFLNKYDRHQLASTNVRYRLLMSDTKNFDPDRKILREYKTRNQMAPGVALVKTDAMPNRLIDAVLRRLGHFTEPNAGPVQGRCLLYIQDSNLRQVNVEAAVAIRWLEQGAPDGPAAGHVRRKVLHAFPKTSVIAAAHQCYRGLKIEYARKSSQPLQAQIGRYTNNAGSRFLEKNQRLKLRLERDDVSTAKIEFS